MAPSAHHDAAAVAAFDLDGTLTEGGSVVHWLSAVAGRATVRTSILRHGPALLAGAIRSGHAADAAKESLFTSVLAGRDGTDVAAVSQQFADEHLRTAVRPEIAGRLGEHLDAGHLVVLVSASPALYVRRIAEAIGAHGSAATELAVDGDGRLTGRYDGQNCRGEEKLRKVRALLGELGAADTGQRGPLYVYGNSRGDLRLLAAADRPVDVSRLGRLGRLGRFPRLDEVAVDVVQH
jgi:phosphatidylglycerophosphatase C